MFDLKEPSHLIKCKGIRCWKEYNGSVHWRVILVIL